MQALDHSAWSSGRPDRVLINDLFPEIETASVVVRKPEVRVVCWSLDLQELVHLLSIVRLIKPRRVLEIRTHDGFSALSLAANLDSEGELQMLALPQSQSQEVLRASGISHACVLLNPKPNIQCSL